MSLEDGQKMYVLKYPLKYKYKGETKTAVFLELHEPKMSHSRNFSKIEQMVSGLLTMSALKFQKLGLDKDTIISGTEVKTLADIDPDEFDSEAHKFSEMLGSCFGFSDDPNLQANFVETFAAMACNSKQSSVCVVDGEVPMSDVIWLDMDPRDGKGAAVLWAAFFTMPSELTQDEDSSKRSE